MMNRNLQITNLHFLVLDGGRNRGEAVLVVELAGIIITSAPRSVVPSFWSKTGK